jgi:broad specificity phosphatase PhoE
MSNIEVSTLARRPEDSIETLLVLRHGTFIGNVQTEMTGEAAAKVVAAGRQHSDYDDLPLLPRGRGEVEKTSEALRFILKHEVSPPLIPDVCLCSPARRATESAEIFLTGRLARAAITPCEELRERDHDRFSYMPYEWVKEQPDYPGPGFNRLTRRFNDGESLQEMIDGRLQMALLKADRLAAGGVALFVTHSDPMLGIRAKRTVAAMPDAPSSQLLVPDGGDHLRNARIWWVGPAQLDMHVRRNPFTGELSPNMTHFRSIAVSPTYFDTGWMPNWRTTTAT